MNGNNCLIVLPTGGGKTVCYSVPGLISGSIVVIICPLISLMMDQVNFLRSKGLNVTYINSSISQSDKDIIIHNLLSAAPEYNFLFLTPETATSPDMLDVLAKMKLSDSIAYIVVDECHCIDMWGFDFRPAYANLGLLTGLRGMVRILELAGRDGEDSRTYMLFRFEDRTKHLKMISALEDSEHRVFKIKKLNEIVKFCIIPQCRRVQIIEFFGEQGADKCGTKCDFCLGGTSNIKEDGKNDALTILQCLENMQKLIPKVTLHNLVLTFRGSKRKEVLNKNLNTIPEFGKGKERFSETGLKHFIQLLISDGVITETLPGSNETSTTPFLVNGNRTNDIKNGKLDIWKYV